eukprot:CAMPEP_0176097476 /NCGR_PEP_ID=MMETSP0120_2-20121206/48869_1 /TAXON_ID=160619 /ORGANISM="Kryptoperidinium foliaceum, Strain CCMP 1326" /LENGTH=78 /DNA_ID=CAMNT_0017431471 /DNA_START=117 /DNA_END=354 /DNA_ORIENTATION=+
MVLLLLDELDGDAAAADSVPASVGVDLALEVAEAQANGGLSLPGGLAIFSSMDHSPNSTLTRSSGTPPASSSAWSKET